MRRFATLSAMPTNPIPAQYKTLAPVQPRVTRVPITSDSAVTSTQLQKVQTNLADRVDEALKFINTAFSAPTATKATAAAALIAGSSQVSSTADKNVSFRGQPSHVWMSAAYVGYIPAVSLSGTQTGVQPVTYMPQGSTPAATAVQVNSGPLPFNGNVVGLSIAHYTANPTAGTATYTLYNLDTGQSFVLFSTLPYAPAQYLDLTTPIPFKRGHRLFMKVSTVGWAQSSSANMELKLYVQS